jgi:hypothetical protein
MEGFYYGLFHNYGVMDVSKKKKKTKRFLKMLEKRSKEAEKTPTLIRIV